MKQTILLLATIAALAPCLPVASNAATQVYDLKADWSNTQNPNGTWTYCLYPGGPPLTNDPFPWAWDYSGGSYSDGLVAAITKTTAASAVPGYREVGDIYALHVSGGGAVCVRWTTPGNGTINVSGAIWNGTPDGCTYGEWTLARNGNSLSVGYWNNSPRSAPDDLSAGSAGPNGLLNIPVQAGDQMELYFEDQHLCYPNAFGIDFTVTFTPDSSGCPNASFADDAIIWHQPLARNGASEDTDPSAGRTVKYRFKRGSTIPIQIHALSCAGADVTSNANVIGKVTVFGDSNCDGAADANAAPIDFNGVGGGGGVMDKIGGHLKYNLDTKSLPTTTQCYILRVTVTDTSTGEEKFEEVLLQAK